MEGVGVLREQTKRFILENPTDVVFTRNAPVPDGAGGNTTTPTPLAPQTVRIVQQSGNFSIARRTVSGDMVTPDTKVVAVWDADVQRKDTFEWQGLDLEVVWVVTMPYEKTIEVAVR